MNNPSVSLTHTFQIHFESKIDGKIYTGQFTTHKLNLKDMMRVGVLKAELLSGYSYNPGTGKGISFIQDMIGDMISMCQVSLISKPEWFNKPEELVDLEILSTVYEEVRNFEDSFRKSSTGNNERGGESGVSGNSESGGTSQADGKAQSKVGQPLYITQVVD